MAAKERRRRVLMRGSAFSAILIILGSVGAIGAVTLRRYNATPNRTAAAQTVRQVVVQSPAAQRDSTPAAVAAATPPVVAQPTVAASPVIAATKPISPIVPEGTSTLPGGMTATRHDSVVVLSFDFAGARTRIPERFERLVRTTLPTVYGARADSAVRAIPDGGIAKQGDLLTDLTERGVRIPVAAGWTIALFPIARPGRDGPLVTQYRVTVTKG